MSTADSARSAADRNATTGAPDQIPDLLGPAWFGLWVPKRSSERVRLHGGIRGAFR